MNIEIRHLTQYSYSRPVFLEPHTLRFCPRSDGYQRPESVSLQIRPEPAGMSHCLDAEGNNITVVWFNGTHGGFSIMAQARVALERSNAFDYLLELDRTTLPMLYPEALQTLLVPALQRVPEEHGLVDSFCRTLLSESGHYITHFLDLLTRRVHALCKLENRASGDPYAPGQTLAERKGACRDLAVLFMDVCRAAGLAARFVSGYQHVDPEHIHDLHGWAEVYIPGAGWRGYDPTYGSAVSNGHVVAAAATQPRMAAPVTGAFRGNATAMMQSTIDVRRL